MHHKVRSRMGALVLLVVLAISATACGRKGDPLPPLRYIPVAATDFEVRQQGSELIFGLAYPQNTTSGQVLPGLDRVEIWQLATSAGATPVDRTAFQAGAEPWVRIEGVELEGATVGDQIRTRLPAGDLIQDEADGSAFAVKTTSSTGEESDFSNIVQVALTGVLEPPREVEVSGTATGVAISWAHISESEGFNVYRRLAAERTYEAALATTEAGATSFVDTSARTGQRYIYAVRTVGSVSPLVESGASGEREIDYVDRFPPEPPQRLIVLGESGQVRLVWEASESLDVTGYRVYRQDATGQGFRGLGDGEVRDLEFLDTGLTPGLAYSYRITALDGSGNESEISNVAEVIVP